MRIGHGSEFLFSWFLASKSAGELGPWLFQTGQSDSYSEGIQVVYDQQQNQINFPK